MLRTEMERGVEGIKRGGRLGNKRRERDIKEADRKAEN